MRKFLPLYEANPKHRAASYTDDVGDIVSAMPLSDSEAAGLLLLSVPDGKDRIAYHEESKAYYRFKLTRANIYHGFRVEKASISQQLQFAIESADQKQSTS